MGLACRLAAPLHAQLARGAAPLRTLASADSDVATGWTLQAGYDVGRPTGWVQVRENAIAGTRLPFGKGLGVRTMSTVAAGLRLPLHGGALEVAVSGTTLRGSTLLADSVDFNGSTLAGGTVLKTRTEAGDFLRVVVDFEHRILRVGRRGALLGRAGIDATLLNFRLQGTLTPTSAGHETKEDFVTQELPTPFLGAELDLPVGRRAVFRLSADGSGLPWVSSLRYEGGLVSLTQRRLDGRAGIDVALTSHLSGGAAVQYTNFLQNEQSHEDGNQISLGGLGVALRLSWAR